MSEETIQHYDCYGLSVPETAIPQIMKDLRKGRTARSHLNIIGDLAEILKTRASDSVLLMTLVNGPPGDAPGDPSSLETYAFRLLTETFIRAEPAKNKPVFKFKPREGCERCPFYDATFCKAGKPIWLGIGETKQIEIRPDSLLKKIRNMLGNRNRFPIYPPCVGFLYKVGYDEDSSPVEATKFFYPSRPGEFLTELEKQGILRPSE
jgi:hypothetical protein